MAVEAKEIAQSSSAEPVQAACGGLGPPTLPRYRRAPRPLTEFIDGSTVFEEVAWRQGSKGTMTSHFAVVEVRPAGKEARRTAQEAAGGRNRWDGGAAPADASGRTATGRGCADRLLGDRSAGHHPDC
ncbi:hypothetical protein GCM10009863_67330 [Streptomyces axinellae]|uniref:Uncharacterized protein n=1 Tax=Streptomyces axinellae TaxID=552788 RepID=A0ABP6DFX5_9ACTN